ncbi:hypothetical protein WA158_004507 [Blastocystis sp. Blastoise]
MPKFDLSTTKGVSKMLKSAGLQRLRWYCQMCEKQCRDENGFKCHIASESHLKKMQFFAQNSKQLQYQFSKQFEGTYLRTLSSLHGEKMVDANIVYSEMISDKQHVHMNSTCWTTLSGFVQYLGRSGICRVEQKEKGWNIAFISRDPETLKRKELEAKRAKDELNSEQRHLLMIEKQIEEAKAMGIDFGEEPKADDVDINEIKVDPITMKSIPKPEDKPKPVNLFEKIAQEKLEKEKLEKEKLEKEEKEKEKSNNRYHSSSSSSRSSSPHRHSHYSSSRYHERSRSRSGSRHHSHYNSSSSRSRYSNRDKYRDSSHHSHSYHSHH